MPKFPCSRARFFVVRAPARVSHGGAFPHPRTGEPNVNTKLMYLAGCAAAVLALSPLRAGAQDEPGARDEPPKATAPAKEPEARHPGESQQDRMRHCAREAKEKELRGDERRTFMSGCLRTH
jgi:hypothetical protein